MPDLDMLDIVRPDLPGSDSPTGSGIFNDVTAIITAMTDGERPFLAQTVQAVLADREIMQVIVCVSDQNNWVATTLGNLLEDTRLEILPLPLALPGAIRNQAVRHARMPWIAFCDGDDVWCLDKTRMQREYAAATGCDLVGADHYLTNEQGAIRGLGQARYLPMTSSWLVRTELMQRYLFNESLSQGEDGEWWVRTHQTVTKARCAKMLLRYRVRRQSLSSSTPSKQRKAQFVALAGMPVIGPIAFLATGVSWWLSRQNQYEWLEAWTTLASPEVSMNRAEHFSLES
jgi:hypothetical protein